MAEVIDSWKPRVFIAGIMQGSLTEKALHGQDYRERIAKIIKDVLPGADIYDPLAANKNSLEYGEAAGMRTFLRHNNQCSTATDLLIAYAPEASMGTAIEMWEAWKGGAVVITISPMTRNWVVKFLSAKIYPDLETFERGVSAGDVASWIPKESRGEKKN